MRSPEDRRTAALWWATLAALVVTGTLLTVVNGWLHTESVPEAPAGFPAGDRAGAIPLLLDVDGGTDLARVGAVLAERGASATLVGARSRDGDRTADVVDGPLDASAARVRAAGDGRAPVLLSTTYDRGGGPRPVTVDPTPGDGRVVLREDLVSGRSCPAPGPGRAIWAGAADLERVLDDLARCGTTTSALGVPPVPAERGLATVVVAASIGAPAITTLLVGASLLYLARNLCSLTAALVYRRRRRRPRPPRSEPRAPISVLVPAYNEEAGIVATLRSIVRAAWPGCEIVVVDDGSTDATARVVREAALPMVTFVSQPNGGKHDALNTALAHSRHELVVMVDGDTILHVDALAELHDAADDPALGAVSGNIKIGNRVNLLTWWQHLEFVTSYNLDRTLYHLLGVMPTVPGALGLFRRSAVAAVGGVSGATVAEDTDLTIAIQKAGFRVEHAAGAIAWTEAPATVRQLYSQRFRWSFGPLQALWRHRRWRDVRGRMLYAYVVAFQVLLPFLGLLGDATVLYLLVTDPGSAGTLLAAAAAAQTAMTAVALRLDDERMWPSVFAPLQGFFYRQFLYVTVVHSVLVALVGTAVRWQKLRRLGTGHAALAGMAADG